MSKLAGLKKSEKLRSSSENMLSKEAREKYFPSEKVSVLERINQKLKNNRKFVKISKKLKLEPIYLLLILLTPVIILLFTFFTFTTTMISTLFPLYMSFKTLQYQVNRSKVDGRLYKKEDEDKNTTQWLSYWLLYAFVNNIECILGSLIFKIPLYKLLKFIFFLMCFLPQVQLSVLIYTYVTSKLYVLYGENFEKNIVSFMRKIFSNKNAEETNEEENPFTKGNPEELIDDNFVKRKKNE